MKTAKKSFLTIRVSEEVRDAFIAKASEYGTPSELLRELVDAFVENRMKIEPPNSKWVKELWNVD